MKAIEHYLGDGLYVSHNAAGFVLRTPRAEGDHWVALDDAVLAEFLDYVKEIRGTTK